MDTKNRTNQLISRERLAQLALIEDSSESISVGGLACDLGLVGQVNNVSSVAFGKLVELVRRARNLSQLALAELAEIDCLELIEIERGQGLVPEPRTIHQLAKVLELPYGELLELSGLARSRGKSLDQDAIRFAAKSGSVGKLTREEHDALEEFVRVLVDRSKKDVRQ